MYESSKRVKVVFVGDGAVGKTCLVTAYGENGFPQTYVPTVAKVFENLCEYDGQSITLEIWDTGGQDEFKTVRPLSYVAADAIVVCFSLVEKSSLNNACEKWLTELQNAAPRNIAIILVGCKSDLRDAEPDNPDFISYDEGSEKADEFKFLSYVECSALLFKNCDTVFSEALRTAILLKKTKPKGGAGQVSDGNTCFLKGQQVTRYDKATNKVNNVLIEDIRIADQLLSWNQKLNKPFWDRVNTLQHFKDGKANNQGIRIKVKDSILSLADDHIIIVYREGKRIEIAADQAQTGDKMVYLPLQEDGQRIQKLQEIEQIEPFTQKRSEFVEMHTASYTVITNDILSHCSSTRDVALLRPLEQVFGQICPHTMNKVYSLVKQM